MDGVLIALNVLGLRIAQLEQQLAQQAQQIQQLLAEAAARPEPSP